MEEYDKNAWYQLVDKDGNVTDVSHGTNGYVWQAMENNIPVYVNSKGEWYTQPYLESTPTGIIFHTTDWFNNSPEYNEWTNTYLPQVQARSLTKELFNEAQDILRKLGNQGILRQSTYNQSEESGLIDPSAKQFVFDSYLSAIREGAEKVPASLLAYNADASEVGPSAAEFARSYKKMSKEELSKTLLKWEFILDKNNTVDTQEEKANVLAAYKILSLIADNPGDFGDGKEFEGLLEASEWQKFQTHINHVTQTLSENLPIVTLGARLGSGLGSMAGGRSFAEGWKIENRRNQRYGYLRDEATGGGLRGTEGSAISGTWAGAIISMAATMVEAMAFGKMLKLSPFGSSVGGFLNGGSNALTKLGGGMVFDFFFNDLPVDLSLFVSDWAATGSPREAWESTTGETQPLFGLFGPEVPAGLKYNLIGDGVLDLTIPIVGLSAGTMYDKLNELTGGSVGKIRELVAVKNLAVQQRISDLPVIGTGLQKFSNWLFGAENAALIRETRKSAIIQGSMTPYIDAQNLLTLKNHYGAEVVAPMYKRLLDDLGITDQMKEFQKNARELGGIGEVKVEWDTAEGGVKKHMVETVKDDLPRDVKRGLLDYQRLEELKGEMELDGEGLVSNPKRDKEIATLEKRVEELPDEIKRFAENFSELNKRVEQLGVSLGLTTQEWIDSLLQDPRWKNYMVRQVLVPGGIKGAGSFDPATNKLLTGNRKGYYNPDQTLSPVMALDMKVHAMGNAYAWNERAKALVAAELVQGKITAGGDSIELAKRIKEKRDLLATQEAYRNQLGFDGIVNGYNERMGNLSGTIKRINDRLNGLENTTVKSVYTDGKSPELKGFVSDYNNGKITYADGVRENAGLSVEDGNSVINNTYRLAGGGKTSPSSVSPLRMADDADYPGFKVEARADGNSGKLRLLDESNPKFSNEGTARDYYRDWKGRELRVVEMSPGEYDRLMARDNRSLNPAERDRASFYTKKFDGGERVDIPYIDYDNNWKISGQEGRHRAAGAEDAGLEKIPVIIDYPKGKELPDFLSKYTDVTDSFVIKGDDVVSGNTSSDYYAGVNTDGVPYRYTVEDGKITSMEKITDEEGLAESLSGINKNFSVAPVTIKAIGTDNAAALNRAALFFRDNFPNMDRKTNFIVGKTRTRGAYGEVIANPEINLKSDGTLDISFNAKLSNEVHIKGKEKILLQKMKGDEMEHTFQVPGRVKTFTGSWHPKNSADLSQTPIHESTHLLVQQILQAEENVKIKNGTRFYSNGILSRQAFYERKKDLEDRILQAAAQRIGKTFNDDLRGTISIYALYNRDLGSRNAETITEAIVDYAFNGSNAAEFSVAIAQELSSRMQKHAMVVSPLETLKQNGITPPKGLLKDGEYAFPGAKKITTTEIRVSNPLLNQRRPISFHMDLFHGKGKAKGEIYTGAQVPILGKGKYWAFTETDAKNFGNNIETAYVQLQNPLQIFTDDDWRDVARQAGWKYPNPVGMDEATMKKYADDLRKLVVDSGYDGIVVQGVGSPSSDGLLKDVFGVNQVVDYGVELKTVEVETGEVREITNAEKAEWLNKWRQNNPYLKNKFDDETFQKANLWDSFFQKEIGSYDPNYRTAAPDALIKKSGDYTEKVRAEAAKNIIDEIKKLSADDFDTDLAMIIMGRNGDDIAKAMDNYIIRQIEISAEELAKNMEGGLTPENLNTAKITLWSDESIKASTQEMLMSLVPDGGDVVASKINILFDEQAKGLAAYEKLPVDTKELMAEKEALVDQLYKENNKVIKKGKHLDKKSSFRNGGSHVIHYKEGGEDVYVTVDDPVIASILQKPYDFKNNGMVRESIESIANFLATTYRLGTTGINPMAFIRNVLRDPIQAMATAGFNPLTMHLSPETFYKTLRQYGLDDDTIAEVTARIRNWAKSGTMTQEMRLGPGKNIQSYRNNVERVSNGLKKVTNGKVITTLQTPLETWEQFFRNQIGQQSFAKNFKRTGDVNKALSSALFDTSNATTNFSHAIGKWRWATSTVPYLSSAVNGTVSFWRLFNVDPIGMVGRITAGFMLPVMAITAWNLSSEENRRAYETLPEWFRQGHLVMNDGSGNILALPLPEEIQNFAGVARKLIEYTNEVSPQSLATIAAQGAFGFLPFEVDGFFADDGSIQLKEGAFQLASGLLPQAATTFYEWVWKHDLFTGEDLSTYSGFNQTINNLSNIFGTGIKQAFNSIGIMFGVDEKDIIGKSFQDTVARDLFGLGFNAAKNQFMEIVGSPAKLREDGKVSPATGLFKKNEDLKQKVDLLSSKIAVAKDDEKKELEEQKKKLIDDFTNEVVNAMNNYQRMFQLTGGLEAWQKNRLVQLLMLGDAWSSADSDSYQYGDASTAYLNERSLAQQRYVDAGLPAGPDIENLAGSNSIELQAAISRFYGTPKQATQDYKNAIEATGLKDIRNEFYDAIQQIYDAADAQGAKPDYDLIERIQARYLQAVDAVLAPLINQYGINILNNNDFIDAVRRQVNGMIPSDDWRQSVRNAKKFLSSKDFPTTTVDVKKWLKQRYASGMRDRGLNSDAEVTKILESIKADIDAGRKGAAKGKINSLRDGVNKANYYISAKDFQTLTEYNNMVK